MEPDAVQRFADYLAIEKKYSRHTCLAYGHDLDSFSQFAADQFEINDIRSANHTVIRSWLAELLSTGISPRAVNRKISSLKTFYLFLIRNGEITVNPMLKVVAPKMSEHLPAFVNQTGMNELLDNITFSGDFQGLRERLILALLYHTGCRLAEIVGLEEVNINRHDQTLKVLGKRNKERIIPYNSELQQLIDLYLLEKKRAGLDAPFLLVTNENQKIYHKFVYRVVNRYLGAVTSIQQRSPHVLRHTYATHMLENGADLNAIKTLLGHASLAATQVYTHNSIEQLKRVYKQSHPKILNLTVMQIEIQSIHFDADQKLLDYITKRIEKLQTFYDGIIDATVYLKVDKSSDKTNKTLEIKLNVLNQTLFCEEHCTTFECAADLAIESLKVQLKRYKDKVLAK